ncbi:hypothetical protein [Pseudomonas phage vB_PaeM_PAO1_Ab03]|uniref:Uncharacterized protein n=1 Tax=Pseudomonas phage vB_PaeM_PAO1_Ab03 TaxID=1548901 RepID=A0A0A1IVD9_9CAUD|nr:hypothetical protein VC54_gp116 [Pseudomonas phage vB_PaeM_PAO1_Ab03]CEF89200.1 hypothetical protein [Pseudomonas phage vB_PaeM_PAO1_Ab03]
MELDIRNPGPPFDTIRIADIHEDLANVCLVTCQEAPHGAVRLVYPDEGQGSFGMPGDTVHQELLVDGKEHALFLIMALEKSIELGWLK